LCQRNSQKFGPGKIANLLGVDVLQVQGVAREDGALAEALALDNERVLLACVFGQRIRRLQPAAGGAFA
jgi:hypothetical protein